MPFPLAHPAAILPLRRFCPKRLDFPALFIGSLVPDTAYGFDGILNSQFHLADLSRWIKFSHLADLSHSFLAGAFCFDLPTGFIIWLVFQVVRRPLAALLPGRFQHVLRPRCHWSARFLWAATGSVLIGTWTHLLLDSATHEDGWIVMHVPFLQYRFWQSSSQTLELCDILYYAFTFCGAGWLALCYLLWEETTLAQPNSINLLTRWGCAMLFALGTLAVAMAGRSGDTMSLTLVGIISTLLILGLLTTITILVRK